MDVFKQNRYLMIAVILLVIVNGAALAVIWMRRPDARQNRPVQEREHIRQILREELSFDQQQTERFFLLRKNLRDRVSVLEREIKQLKKQMFDEALRETPPAIISDSLLTLVQNKQAHIERLSYRHLLDLRELCNPSQFEKLRSIMRELFRKPPDDGPQAQGPPRRPQDRRLPPRGKQ